MADDILLEKMDKGFDRVFGKIDGLGTEIGELKTEFVNHKEICLIKFGQIDTKMAVNAAINGERQVASKNRIDWGKWFVRITLGGVFLASITQLIAKIIK